jgi:1-phosphatidylinositol-4-phosphate 5-kinase
MKDLDFKEHIKTIKLIDPSSSLFKTIEKDA